MCARKAEDLGYDSPSINDQLAFRTSLLDAASTLSSIAAITDKIRSGTSILNIVIRTPVFLQKHYHQFISFSHEGYLPELEQDLIRKTVTCRIPFEERWQRFTDWLEILVTLWNQNNNENKTSKMDYNDRYYKLKYLNDPKPIQRHHPPVLVGSRGSDVELLECI